jgi:outer membrane protein
MNNPLRTLLAAAAFGFSGLLVQAQPAPKILIVDMAKLYDTHYKTEEQNAKLRGDQQLAEESLQKMNTEGSALVEQYKELTEQAKNPALTTEARGNAEKASAGKYEEIQRKQQEVASFRDNTTRTLQQRIKTFRDLMLEEISKVASDIAKKKGATLLIDKAGPSLIGVSNIIYSDPAYDITDEVMKEVNKDKPATAMGAPGTAPSSSPGMMAPSPSPSSASPMITVPGASTKK